ncbi:Replication protein A 32 kDa subunit A [Apostasia shenzhenica]|uniref:Replication protein A 32 kDa subunit A n=1 Tax=Apostasia shenzhenica TaxID=1088818 RepID=A0A2H9ZXQ7_9ASPA|nr:Replication protein A 32 kDa subunit A [Apostasia shenzhenica]
MSYAQYDAGASLFSGGGFMPSQATQTPESGFFKVRNAQGILPLTVKQIGDAYDANDDKSNFVVDGADATNVKLLGIMISKIERVTDVSFTLDDGTGRISVNRWINESSDTNEMALVHNGAYVSISGSLKGFQGKRQVVAYSVRPVIDFNEVTLHYLECIHVHLDNTRPKVENDINKMVLDVFLEPASLAREQGLHVDEVARKLGLPMNKIKEAIHYHNDLGHIYSTIDDFHYKSTMNG